MLPWPHVPSELCTFISLSFVWINFLSSPWHFGVERNAWWYWEISEWHDMPLQFHHLQPVPFICIGRKTRHLFWTGWNVTCRRCHQYGQKQTNNNSNNNCLTAAFRTCGRIISKFHKTPLQRHGHREWVWCIMTYMEFPTYDIMSSYMAGWLPDLLAIDACTKNSCCCSCYLL